VELLKTKVRPAIEAPVEGEGEPTPETPVGA
jgi:hypothetical protein